MALLAFLVFQSITPPERPAGKAKGDLNLIKSPFFVMFICSIPVKDNKLTDTTGAAFCLAWFFVLAPGNCTKAKNQLNFLNWPLQ